MQAEIIAIGDELLIGQTINSNAAWLGKNLNQIGIRVFRSVVIGDEKAEILNMLDEASSRSDVIIITGGLGPTKDDITKHTLCEYFQSDLIINEEALARITGFFQERGLPMLEMNRQQAALPSKCTVIQNTRGTACGMWFEKDGKVFISMPGVPFEMYGMMEDEVLEMLAKRFERPDILHRTIMTIGVGESFLADKIASWENSLAELNIKLAYLPSPGQVKLRMSCYSGDKLVNLAAIKRKESELLEIIGEYVYAYDDDALNIVVGRLLRQTGTTVAVAESCTGGVIANLLTAEPGSSDFFEGGLVTYSERLKQQVLKVPAALIKEKNVVSTEVAEVMALGAKAYFGTDYALATTGIAGPGGGTEEIPVGTICIALATPNGTVSKRYKFVRRRDLNIEMACNTALNMLRKEILKEIGGS